MKELLLKYKAEQDQLKALYRDYGNKLTEEERILVKQMIVCNDLILQLMQKD